MVHEKLIEIDNILSINGFFNFLTSIDVDDALTQRDCPVFDELWMKDFSALSHEFIPNDFVEFINVLREKAFKASFRVAADPELSARISDDIEIIAKNLIIDNEASLSLTYLWPSYLRGEFPCRITVE